MKSRSLGNYHLPPTWKMRKMSSIIWRSLLHLLPCSHKAAVKYYFIEYKTFNIVIIILFSGQLIFWEFIIPMKYLFKNNLVSEFPHFTAHMDEFFFASLSGSGIISKYSKTCVIDDILRFKKATETSFWFAARFVLGMMHGDGAWNFIKR